MAIIRRFISGVMLFFAAIALFSCNLDDFNLKKLANPDDILPSVFAPFAYGTFKVSDLVNIPILAGDPIPIGGLALDPVIISKVGTTFRSSAIDSLYLITHFDNETPCDMEFDLSFINSAAGTQFGEPFKSGKIPTGEKDFSVIFGLGPIEQDNLQKATDIKLNFKLSSPAGVPPITYGVVKSKSFTIKISFVAPVNLRKL